MTLKIPLVVTGLDLRLAEDQDRIGPDLGELLWKANGPLTTAVLFTDASPAAAVAEAGDWVLRIHKHLPGVRVAGVLDELVSVGDIAARVGVSPETARLWATGKRRSGSRTRFPSPRQVVGSDSGSKQMSLYAWREVLSWCRTVLQVDADEGVDYLEDVDLAELQAIVAGAAADLPESSGPAWTPLALAEQDTASTGDPRHRSAVPDMSWHGAGAVASGAWPLLRSPAETVKVTYTVHRVHGGFGSGKLAAMVLRAAAGETREPEPSRPGHAETRPAESSRSDAGHTASAR